MVKQVILRVLQNSHTSPQTLRVFFLEFFNELYHVMITTMFVLQDK